MNRVARGTMGGVFITIILVMALFYETFEYITTNYDQANVTVPLNYTDSYNNLQTAEAELNQSIEGIKTAAQNISEADANVVQVAWNGLTGLAITLRLFIGTIDVGVSVWQAIIPSLSFLPTWAIILAEMAIIITIVIIVISLFKGESRT